VVKTAHNKAKFSFNTPIEKFYYIEHYLFRVPSGTSSALRTYLCAILLFVHFQTFHHLQ